MFGIVSLCEFVNVAGVVFTDGPGSPHGLDIEAFYTILITMCGMPGIHRTADSEFESGASVLMPSDRRQQPGGIVAQLIVTGDLSNHGPFVGGN